MTPSRDFIHHAKRSNKLTFIITIEVVSHFPQSAISTHIIHISDKQDKYCYGLIAFHLRRKWQITLSDDGNDEKL